MDAKVHPVHHHRDAEETFCLVRRRLRQEAAGASADQDADPDAAVRHNFRESSPALVRDFRQSAWAGAQV